MFIRVKDIIINTDLITCAEWRKINVGSPSETHNLLIHFAGHANNGSLNLREDEEVKKLWGILEKLCKDL
jgi:hypothetical protein